MNVYCGNNVQRRDARVQPEVPAPMIAKSHCVGRGVSPGGVFVLGSVWWVVVVVVRVGGGVGRGMGGVEGVGKGGCWWLVEGLGREGV